MHATGTRRARDGAHKVLTVSGLSESAEAKALERIDPSMAGEGMAMALTLQGQSRCVRWAFAQKWS